MCMAMAVYFEARGDMVKDPTAGYAVAEVVMNKIASDRFPDTVCEVVQQHKEGSGPRSCQFSFYCDGLSDNLEDEKAARQSLFIAADVITGRNLLGITADHYHTVQVSPYWSTSMEPVGRVGNHLFFKSK